MRNRRLARQSPASVVLALCLGALPACGQSHPAPSSRNPRCDPNNGDITLPAGFCATVFADAIGVARHLVVGNDGTVYLSLEPGNRTSAGTSRQREPGGIVVLRDTDGDGHAEVVRRIPTGGGTGIALRGEWLYYSTQTTVERVRLSADRLSAAAAPDTVVLGIPPDGHISRSLAFDASGGLFVHVGSEDNVCVARRNQTPPDPCPQLPTRAGIWRYQADRLRQRHPADGEHWAVGLRNAVGLAWDSVTGKLYAASHGRDGLAELYPRLYTPEQSAEQPSEEFVQVDRGDDFGWPYCFHDNALGRKVLAPEFGGDGRTAGRCAKAKQPIIGFPGHWGPDDLLFLRGDKLPAKYRRGVLIAFHGSWNRAPMPQAGYKVVLVPRGGATFGPAYETFADGFAAGRLDPGGAVHRPAGLAEGSDGAIYIADDQRGRVWRVVYTGNP